MLIVKLFINTVIHIFYQEYIPSTNLLPKSSASASTCAHVLCVVIEVRKLFIYVGILILVFWYNLCQQNIKIDNRTSIYLLKIFLFVIKITNTVVVIQINTVHKKIKCMNCCLQKYRMQALIASLYTKENSKISDTIKFSKSVINSHSWL